MQEHTIPESLIEQIRSGKAALVVGAGIGVPSWKQMLERLSEPVDPDALVFAAREGGPFDRHNLSRRQLKATCKKLHRLQKKAGDTS